MTQNTNSLFDQRLEKAKAEFIAKHGDISLLEYQKAKDAESLARAQAWHQENQHHPSGPKKISES